MSELKKFIIRLFRLGDLSASTWQQCDMGLHIVKPSYRYNEGTTPHGGAHHITCTMYLYPGCVLEVCLRFQ
jgi:hypothetical protein